MIAWGLLDCFLGYRIFKITVALSGAVTGLYCGQAAAVALGLGLGGQVGLMLVAGLLGGGLAFMFYLGAVFVTGLLFGLTLGVLLFANFHPGLALIAGCGLGLIGGFTAIKLQKLILILGTALLGAFRALLGMMFFTQQLDWARYLFQQPRQIPVLIDHTAWLLPATLTLAAVGAIAQFELKENEPAKKNRSSGAG